MLTSLLAAGCALAQHPDAVARGRSSFGKYCAGCHGENARGGRAPDLAGGTLKWGASDEAIASNIRNGIAGTQMPPFPMPEAEAADIAVFLRSLRGKAGEKSSGDAAKGEAAFFGVRGCSGCHAFGARGGRLGPDLTEIRGERSLAELREAIRNPDAAIRTHFETVEVSAVSGKSATGVLKSEDTYSIVLMDRNENIRSFQKRDLVEIRRPRRSLMPRVDMSDGEVEDLVAFLTLGDNTPKPAPDWAEQLTKNPRAWQVGYDRLRSPEPENWLHYWGDYAGRHYSALKQVDRDNVRSLAVQWVHQFGGTRIETMPLVADGLMFVTGPLSNASALDARTGAVVWSYSRRLPEVAAHCTVMTNRGVALLGDRVFLGTLDTHLVALDARSGSVQWDVAVDDYKKGFSITHAPLAIDGKIIVGVTAGECALEGFVDAYDAATGKRLWRIWTIPRDGDPARKTWVGNSAEFGGGPTWMTGTYDVDTDTVFWTTGNPSPDYDGSVRGGDNLYTCSVLAIDPNTGKLKWHFQFTPHDTHDWDATETPVLIDGVIKGHSRKLLIQANRNAFFYVLDRTTGEFLQGGAFAKQNWAFGLDAKGHPRVKPGTDPTPKGVYICPDAAGATNWAAPSYSPVTKLFYVAARDVCATYTSVTKEPVPGQPYTGTGSQEDPTVGNPGVIRALDPLTGKTAWDYPVQRGSWSAGVLSTAGGVVFAAGKDGNLTALDAASGKYLWRFQTGAEINSSPVSYMIDGQQFVAVASDSALFVFALAR